MRSRGQTSVEVLLVVAFTIIFSLVVGLPYLENQEKTNVAIKTKVAILPYIEKNSRLVKVSSVQPEVTANGVNVHINTKGIWDTGVILPGTCQDICQQLDPSHYYASVTLDWNHQIFPTNGIVFMCPPAVATC